MPKISGKVTDEYGNPLYQIAVITEIPPSGNTGIADVWADENTGEFTLMALHADSLIQVSSLGYKKVLFPHTSLVPSVIKLQPILELQAPPVRKSNHTWMWFAGGAGLLLLAAATAKTQKAKAAKGLGVPKKAKKTKAKQQPLKVVV